MHLYQHFVGFSSKCEKSTWISVYLRYDSEKNEWVKHKFYSVYSSFEIQKGHFFLRIQKAILPRASRLIKRGKLILAPMSPSPI